MATDICTLAIFGGNGDLAARMLLPSLYYLERDGLLPAGVRILLAARSISEGAEVAGEVKGFIDRFVPGKYFDETAWQAFAKRLTGVQVDATKAEDFSKLAALMGGNCDSVFYLATAPKLYGPICANLAAAGLAGPRSRVVLEKPIGHDLASSREINEAVGAVFTEGAVFRVDHYLGKETVQNLLALRFGNVLFEPLWNSRGIEFVQITVSETVGVEGRWSYYNDSGAMRDMLQNHMLQLLCLVAMEPPASMDPDAVRDEKVKILRSLRPIEGADIERKVVRGVYTAGAIEGKPVPGYADEAGGGPSMTETFVALRTQIDNWRWAGVPFYLRTGKRLAARYTEIFIQFRDVPHSIFDAAGGGLKPNKLIIRLQPEESIKLAIMNKVRGLDPQGIKLHELGLNLSWSEAVERKRIAYERLLLDAIQNRSTLFVRRDEVEAAWTWADRIIKGWADGAVAPKPYAAGTWGPTAAIALPERYGHSWHE